MKTNPNIKIPKAAWIILLVTAVMPGISEKILLTRFNPDCLQQADYYKIKIETSAALSPSLPNKRSENKL